ncbi:MAG: hypothetical protein KBF75_15050 [Saprospiraceae bacterium]|nr:hypothetical protein [Saprospiraceae bacterium]
MKEIIVVLLNLESFSTGLKLIALYVTFLSSTMGKFLFPSSDPNTDNSDWQESIWFLNFVAIKVGAIVCGWNSTSLQEYVLQDPFEAKFFDVV